MHIIAGKNGAVYNIPVEIGSNIFMAKFDTGAGVTVISTDVFFNDKSESTDVNGRSDVYGI